MAHEGLADVINHLICAYCCAMTSHESNVDIEKREVLEAWLPYMCTHACMCRSVCVQIMPQIFEFPRKNIYLDNKMLKLR